MLSEIIYKVSDQSRLTMVRAAEKMGINVTTYRRKANRNDKSEFRFSEVGDYMNAHRDYRPLKSLATQCNHIAIKVKNTIRTEITYEQLSSFLKDIADVHYEIARSLSEESDGGKMITRKEACICFEMLSKAHEECTGMMFTLMDICGK